MDNDPKSFVAILSEELREIGLLRQKRRWHESARKPQPQGGSSAAGNSATAQSAQTAAWKPPDRPEDHADEIIREAHQRQLVGIAFSGGGIRSATFNLGVLQALADLDLLKRFDYLSTVSGGGYIGSWLAAWISRRGLIEVIRGLQTNRVPNRNHWEVEQIRFLRQYSNYLTPRLGLFSLDTWAMIATYMRNALLNLMILVLALAAVLLLPHAGVAVNELVQASDEWPFIWAGVLLFLVVHFMAVNMPSKIFTPPQNQRFKDARAVVDGAGEPRAETRKVRPVAHGVDGVREGFACFTQPVYALVAGAVLLPAAWFLSIWLSKLPSPPAGLDWLEWAKRGAVTYSVLWLLASFVARVSMWTSQQWRMDPKRSTFLCHALTFLAGVILLGFAWRFTPAYHNLLSNHVPATWVIVIAGFITLCFVVVFWISRRRTVSKESWEFFQFSATLFATPYAGALGGVLLGGLISIFRALTLRNWGPFHCLVLGTPLVLVALLFVAMLHVGLTGLMLDNQKREWWSRLGGWVLVLSIAWLVVCGLSLYAGPFPGAYEKKIWGQLVKWGLTPAWILSTVGGVLAGKSKATGDNQKPWLEWAASLAPCIFLVGLLGGLSYFLSHVITFLLGVRWAPPGLKGMFFPRAVPSAGGGSLPVFLRSPGLWLILAAAALLAIAVFLAWRVDINDFSMNLLYRNRLVRCYLGAAHGTWRHPQPFTGFDPEDDLLLKDLRAEKCYSGPFLLINAALNLVKGKELAWQERKAESFVFTPLNCGFDAWLEGLIAPTRYAYRPTECYGYPDTGLYLGTTMSISGAAASPNMGYHSNPALGFLMTVFNVRLGWWAGNPRKDDWQRASPWMGLGYLLSELLGSTDDESRYVYLSDGGHFENLGIYELAKRRCKYILACDAGADNSYAFGDLGNAIRKCREDLGIEIKIKTDRIFPRARDSRSEWHCAVGEVHYENVDPGASPEHPGVLVYLKASLTGDEPADVLNYKTDHNTFPHETTVDQWFTESQFESYRSLGQHIACTVFEKAWNKAGGRATPEQGQAAVMDVCIQQLFESMREAWASCLGNC